MSKVKKTKLYYIWQGMKRRCDCASNNSYKYYGARGITVCDEWYNDFSAFKQWSLNNGYIEGLTIERRNVNGNYEPSNCTWISRKKQAENKTNTLMVAFNGETKRLVEWSKVLNKDKHALYSRLYERNMNPDIAFTKPMKYENLITYNGQTKTLKEWATSLGIAYSTLTDRIRVQKLPIDKAFLINANPTHAKHITHNGQTKTLKEWADIYKIGYSTLKNRINECKWPIEKALTTPVRKRPA